MDPESKSDAVVASCELIEGKVANGCGTANDSGAEVATVEHKAVVLSDVAK